VQKSGRNTFFRKSVKCATEKFLGFNLDCKKYSLEVVHRNLGKKNAIHFSMELNIVMKASWKALQINE
jgi:hypothetical protein